MEKKRLVIKVGTSTLLRQGGGVNLREMDALARVLSDLKNMGHQVILVSSGAIGVGAGKLGLKERPTQLRFKQAAAAAGQCELMHLYDKFFGEYGQAVAQILLTDEDVDHPVRAEHLSGTFEALLELGCIPVVNENDSVSAAEIETGQKKVLGDNDTLSAIVTQIIQADALIILSDIDGLYTADPATDSTYPSRPENFPRAEPPWGFVCRVSFFIPFSPQKTSCSYRIPLKSTGCKVIMMLS